MSEQEINKILTDIRALDPVLRYWIFRDYIIDVEDLEFLITEIEYQISKR